MVLNEQIEALIESSKYAKLDASDSAMMRSLLENTEKEMNQMISEGTLSGDVAQFTPIIMPMVRRVYPTLIANELLGVQPMSMPTGFIYALTNQYSGDGDTKGISPLGNGVALGGQILVTSTQVADGATITGDTSGNVATVVYSEAETDYKGAATGKFLTLVVITAGSPLTAEAYNTAAGTISGVYTNEATFSRILKKYTGNGTFTTPSGEVQIGYKTSEAEQLGKDMKEVGFSVSKKSVEAKSRALKGQYSVEMYQDLKAQHGLSADEEIMSLMGAEMQAEIDREVVDFVNGKAGVATDFVVDSADAYGRWEIEKYRAAAIKISKEAQQIGLDTKRGQGNTLIVAPTVVTMLEQIGGFATAPVATGVKQPVSGGVAGTFDSKYKVVVDQYATSNYCTVLYKGADRRDAMGFFAPYVPLSFTKVTHADSGQPAVIAKTRYAMDTIPGISSATSNDRAEKYAKTFGITFTGTVLA